MSEGFDYNKTEGKKPMMRKPCFSRNRPFMAYDLETTRIAEGTPTVKYLTVYGEQGDFTLSTGINGKKPLARLCEILSDELLTKRWNKYRFVAWNGNGFDVFFIAKALLESEDYIVLPYLTRSKSIRGMRVIGLNSKDGLEWEFLDGMAMTGLDSAKMKLSKFVGLFAPQYPKLELDFGQEEFDPKKKHHVAYAERDSEALYYAMLRANEIVSKLTGAELQPTMGNLAIKYFQSKIPEGVRVWKTNETLREILHGPAKRGGYCWIARQYVGPVWKYDLNQAYAAAMRDAALPCGSCVKADRYNPARPGVYRVTISREKRSPVPFYFRDIETNAGRFTGGKEASTWLLSTEIEHLKADDWKVKIHTGYYWQDAFNMKPMVDELERERFTDPDGPSGALGTMVKQVGNSAYGKTLEQLGGLSYVMSKSTPEGYSPCRDDDDRAIENLYVKSEDSFPRVYHQPQIGCFITAHVRLVVRSAALKADRHFLYADTDCVVFSKAVDFLDIDPRRYGAWKQESDGVEYIMIGKKIYYGEEETPTRHAKGLHVRELSKNDFIAWSRGRVPTQKQMQRKNFIKFMSGEPMFAEQSRTGTDVGKSKQAILVDGEFIPI